MRGAGLAADDGRRWHIGRAELRTRIGYNEHANVHERRTRSVRKAQRARFVAHAEVGAGDTFTRERAETNERMSQLAVEHERVSEDDDAYGAVVE